MSRNDIYDPELFLNFEKMYKEISIVKMGSRHAFGAVYAYYRSNQGTQYGIDFWEENLTKYLNGLRKAFLSAIFIIFVLFF